MRVQNIPWGLAISVQRDSTQRFRWWRQNWGKEKYMKFIFQNTAQNNYTSNEVKICPKSNGDFKTWRVNYVLWVCQFRFIYMYNVHPLVCIGTNILLCVFVSVCMYFCPERSGRTWLVVLQVRHQGAVKLAEGPSAWSSSPRCSRKGQGQPLTCVQVI